MQLIHGYLFFKIPLVRPEPFPQGHLADVSFLFSRTFFLITALAGIVGLYLVSRQWEAFNGTFPYVFSARRCRDLAAVDHPHQIAARARPCLCRSPVWMPRADDGRGDHGADAAALYRRFRRLASEVAQARLAINSAGMLVEFAVAAYALLLWSFLPDGPLRSAVFVLAAVGWVLSLIVNINPFMRFDGYYMLADVVGIENLQPRAFRHMRWRLREFLFGRLTPTGTFSARLDAFLTLYAIATAIYRLMLYLGIALLVYHFLIKIVGIMLFAVEIGFFIIRPAWHELKEWYAMRQDILASPRSYITFAALGVGIALVFIPVSTRVSAPAVLQPELFARLFPQEPGRVTAVRVERGQEVRQGDILFEISSPASAQERKLADIEIALAELRLARIGADTDDLTASGTIERQLASLQAQRAGLEEREQRLIVRAPFDGRMADISASVVPGRWIGRSQQLGYLARSGTLAIRGYVEGDDRARIADDASAIFVPNDLTRSKISVKLQAISAYGVTRVDLPELASVHGGPVAVYEHANHTLSPVTAHYAVRGNVVGDMPPVNQTVRGTLLIDARPESLAARLWRWVGRVFVREFGV